jgi:hypothetical protein
MWPFPSHHYASVTSGSDNEAFLDDADSQNEDKQSTSIVLLKRWHWWIPSLHVLLLTMNLILFVISVVNLDQRSGILQLPESSSQDEDARYHNPSLNPKLKAASSFCKSPSQPRQRSPPQKEKETNPFPAPILDAFDLKPQLRRFNGALRDNTSIWRQPPSAEVDSAWDFISTEGLELITVPSSAVLHSHKPLSKTIKAPDSWGYGSDAYLAQIEVFHQIHCLNELRKNIHYDHYYGAASPPDELHRAHVGHCIHMILQALTCAADVGVITHNWVRSEKVVEPKVRVMPDFNVVKMCRDFDGLLDWAREKGVKGLKGKWRTLRYPGEGVEIVEGDGYA